MDWLTIVLSIIGGFIFFCWLVVYREKKYFESRGIYHLGNGLVNIMKALITKQTFADSALMQYQQMKDKKVKIAGTNDFGMVSLMITDLELLKKIYVKDFDHFEQRRKFQVSKKDVLFSKMLILQTGEEWKFMRSKMSPTFTTGKIKRMFQIFNSSSKKLVKFVEQEMNKAGQMDLTEGYSKYTMDVIASAAFGLDSKAFEHSDHSLFEKMGKRLQFDFGGTKLLQFIVITILPKVADLLGWSFFETEVQDFFSGVIKSTIKHRQETGEKRDDFIQLMLEAREGKLKLDASELSEFEKQAIIKDDTEGNTKLEDLLNDEGIVANCVLFILGGFDTTQSLLLYAAYALAINPDVQDKLRAEIEETLEQNDGDFTYEAITNMKYMDMVINETLRMYPPAALTDRGCTQDYKVPGTDFVLKKGQGVLIPIIGIHHDEDYYPNPSKFDPERFAPENRSNMNQFAFMPFGQGPRNCIGMRFALTEVKLAIAHLVQHFHIEPSEKTLIPMKFQNTGSLKPVGGMWLALRSRN